MTSFWISATLAFLFFLVAGLSHLAERAERRRQAEWNGMRRREQLADRYRQR